MVVARFFAYGSLLSERLPYVVESTPARLLGYQRSLCLYSWVYRGTQDAPGLVLGLERAEAQAACHGSVLRVAGEHIAAATSYFDERELINGIYHRELVQCVTAAGPVSAYAYVADADHPQYCGTLPNEQVVRLVAAGVGTRGTTIEYLRGTLQALRMQGVHEPELERVLAAATALTDDRS